MLLKKNCGGKTRTIKIRVSDSNFLLTKSPPVVRLKDAYRWNECPFQQKAHLRVDGSCLGTLAGSRPLQKEAQYVWNADAADTLCGTVSLQPYQLCVWGESLGAV